MSRSGKQKHLWEIWEAPPTIPTRACGQVDELDETLAMLNRNMATTTKQLAVKDLMLDLKKSVIYVVEARSQAKSPFPRLSR